MIDLFDDSPDKDIRLINNSSFMHNYVLSGARYVYLNIDMRPIRELSKLLLVPKYLYTIIILSSTNDRTGGIVDS